MKRTSPKSEWLERLPHSQMIYPEALTHRIKYYLWRLYTPYHPKVRDSVTTLRILKNHGRQPFLLGKISPKYTIQEFVEFLTEKGYAYHRVAWMDPDEVVSLRYVENFIYQYHIRIYKDREIRGHYEYTPECYPLLHLFDIGREPRREEFLALFGEMIIPHTSADRSEYRWEFLPARRRLWNRKKHAEASRGAPTRPNTDRK